MIFVSAPYSHSDTTVRHDRYLAICKYTAQLMAQGQTAISPIIPGHVLLEHATLPTDFDFWKKYCFEIMDACDAVHVLQLEGWNKSTGVEAEVQRAVVLDIPVQYIPME